MKKNKKTENMKEYMKEYYKKKTRPKLQMVKEEKIKDINYLKDIIKYLNMKVNIDFIKQKLNVNDNDIQDAIIFMNKKNKI